MNNLQDTSTRSPSPRFRLMMLVVLCTFALFAFIFSLYSGNLPSRASAAASVHTSTALTTKSYPVKVFFSQSPTSFNNSSAVYPVDRTSPTIAVGTFSLQLLLAGPTLSEQQAGYFTELNTMLSGPSNCTGTLPVGGPDFTLTLNKKGSKPETGTATVQFCRSISSAGIGADARVTAQIDATLKQFPNIKKVVILTKDGHCFGDESGNDLCLR